MPSIFIFYFKFFDRENTQKKRIISYRKKGNKVVIEIKKRKKKEPYKQRKPAKMPALLFTQYQYALLT